MWDRYFTGEFSQAHEGLGGRAIWQKDLGYARQVAQESNIALPLAGVLEEAYKASTHLVEPEDGHAAAIIAYWMHLNGAADRYQQLR